MTYKINNKTEIVFAHEGENNAREIRFDVSGYPIDPNNPFVSKGYSDTYDPTMLARVLDLQDKGYHFMNHGYHESFWKNNSSRNLELCKMDYIHSSSFLKQSGILDTDLWLSPYGVNDSDVQNLLKDLGASCSVATSGHNNHYWQNGRYNINRAMINKSATYGVAQYKQMVDQCLANGDWLVFGTYVNDSTYWDANFVKEIFQYAQSKGIEIVPFNVGWHRRHQIYDYYDLMTY